MLAEIKVMANEEFKMAAYEKEPNALILKFKNMKPNRTA